MHFGRRFIPINQEFQPGDIVAFGSDPEYGLLGYARIISPEDYERLGEEPIPNAGNFLKGWGYEVRKKGFVYVETCSHGNESDIFYNIMPALWIHHKVEDIDKEIKSIRETVENNIRGVRYVSKASIDFLKKTP